MLLLSKTSISFYWRKVKTIRYSEKCHKREKEVNKRWKFRTAHKASRDFGRWPPSMRILIQEEHDTLAFYVVFLSEEVTPSGSGNYSENIWLFGQSILKVFDLAASIQPVLMKEILLFTTWISNKHVIQNSAFDLSKTLLYTTWTSAKHVIQASVFRLATYHVLMHIF